VERRLRVGIIGCGNISGQYLTACATFPVLQVVACADVDQSKAEERAAEYGIRAITPREMLADPEIEIVINLTIPAAHAEVSRAALEAGKHVYSEKPLAISREDGQRLLASARERGLRLGCAPDTFLGGGLQTCRKLLDEGWIGEPVAATAFMTSHGPESWHPNPAFFYQTGAGPMFDMGPYYLTALIHLLGPVRRVTGTVSRSFLERVATSQSRHGERIPVETATHVTGILEFNSGPVATLITSFDIWHASLPRIEIYGSEGTLSVPDPNIFGGPVRLRRAGAQEWSEIPLSHDASVGRGIGVADMAYSVLYGRPHRASGKMAYHVLDLMHAFHDASSTGQHIALESHCERPAPLPLGLVKGFLDAGTPA
jgi:predicted dehydrogenase